MGGWCKERYNKDENNKLEGLHQKQGQMEETRWEGQNFSEVVAPQEEEEEEEEEEDRGRGYISRCRGSGAWSQPPIQIQCQGQEFDEIYFHFNITFHVMFCTKQMLKFI